MRRLLLAFAVFVAFSAPARADWHEAQSDHFVVYADDSEKDVRKFAQMLENYHAAMILVTGRAVEVPSPSNRVTIYAVGSTRDVRKLNGGDNKYVRGFYVPRAGGSRAFVPDIRATNGQLDESMVILLHEYAHHFLISSSRFEMPRWLSEGAAEFFASAQFPRDGGIKLGLPAYHRASELAYAERVSLEELFDRDLYNARKSRKYDAFYGRSWLLFHYLTFEESRKGQVTAYWQAMQNGEEPLQAAKDVFGDLELLEKELNKYQKARYMTSFNIPPDMLKTGTITTRQVSKGQAAMLPVAMRSQRGVNEEQAAEVLIDARKIAARFPADAAVQAALAEAEFDAGNDDEAIAAADRAITANPATKNAYVQKGYALFRKAEDADDEDAAYKAAMVPFSALNKLENDHPLPLIYFYRSYQSRGIEPPEHARHALERAGQLAPFDQGLWMNVAVMEAQEGQISLAKRNLAPLAANPHGGPLATQAQRLIEALENAPEGEPFNRGQMLNLEVDEDAPEGT